MHRGEPILVYWYTHRDGEAVRSVARVASDGEHLAQMLFTRRERAVDFARLMNTIPKIVISTTLQRLDWATASAAIELQHGQFCSLCSECEKE